MSFSSSHAPKVAILGATGLVGREMLSILEQREFPLQSLKLLASARSVGSELSFRGESIAVEAASSFHLRNVDLVLSSAGGSVSKLLLPDAAKFGAVCIDNTSAFRLHPKVPLVVPEVNAAAIKQHQGIIANPNCSTIQLAVALKPILDSVGIKRVTVSTYQSVSGAGATALQDLQANQGPYAADVVPQIGALTDDGETEEERKMRLELPKILGSQFEVDACCVRVPVFRGHAESVWVDTVDQVSLADIREQLSKSPGLRLRESFRQPDAQGGSSTTPPGTPAKDSPLTTPATLAGTDPVFVDRLRQSNKRRLSFWVVADNLRKGAALNAVQIAESIALIPSA
jgi:aspartate-semialdehyde dehydrogenase